MTLGTNLGTPEFRHAVTTAFAKRYGITVELRILEGAELVTVVGRECAAGRASMDVLLGGLITLHPKGCLVPMKPRLLLPEVNDGKYWRGGALDSTISKASISYSYPSLLLRSFAVQHPITSKPRSYAPPRI